LLGGRILVLSIELELTDKAQQCQWIHASLFQEAGRGKGVMEMRKYEGDKMKQVVVLTILISLFAQVDQSFAEGKDNNLILVHSIKVNSQMGWTFSNKTDAPAYSTPALSVAVLSNLNIGLIVHIERLLLQPNPNVFDWGFYHPDPTHLTFGVGLAQYISLKGILLSAEIVLNHRGVERDPFAVNLGAGIDYPLFENLSARAQYRHFIVQESGQILKNWGIGLAYRIERY